MKIAAIHATMNAVKPLQDAFQTVNPEMEIVNFVNEELLRHANQVNGVDAWGVRNFLRLVMQAAEADVQGILIACSLYGYYQDTCRLLTDKELITIDTPMIQEAVAKGNKIGVIATTASAGPAEVKKVCEEAARTHKIVKTELRVVTEAMTCLKAGNQEGHNRLIRKAGKELVESGCDIVILSQITMACAQTGMREFPVPVLTSPDSGARYMSSVLAK